MSKADTTFVAASLRISARLRLIIVAPIGGADGNVPTMKPFCNNNKKGYLMSRYAVWKSCLYEVVNIFFQSIPFVALAAAIGAVIGVFVGSILFVASFISG